MPSCAEGCFKVVAKCLPNWFEFDDRNKKSLEKWKEQNRNKGGVYKYVSLDNGGDWLKAIRRYRDIPQSARNKIEKTLDAHLYEKEQREGREVSAEERIRERKKYGAKEAQGSKESRVECLRCTVVLHGAVKERGEEQTGIRACWDLSKRGEVGETPFHICYLLDSPDHRDLADLLLDICPNLSLDVYEAPEYLGESALHLAIVNGNMAAVERLVACGASVQQRATGRFFLPEDQKDEITGKTDYIGYAYYGEYPLSFAACFGREDMYDFLLDHSADPRAQDVFGNTVLHMIVIHKQQKMFGHALEKGADLLQKNKAGLDPLMLAAKMGHHVMFDEVLSHHSTTKWRWFDITCSIYSLRSLDTITSDGKYNTNNALQHIIENESEGHLAMLDNPVVNELLEKKWEIYGRSQFLFRLICAIIHLTALTLTILLPGGCFQELLMSSDATSVTRVTRVTRVTAEITLELSSVLLILLLTRLTAEIMLGFSSVLHVLLYIFLQLGCFKLINKCACRDQSKRRISFREVFQDTPNPVHTPFKVIFMASCLLVVAATIARLSGRDGAWLVCLTIATPLAWAYLLFFISATQLLGPFVVMIYEMCITDIVRFSIIYLIFLLQFSQGFFFLFKDPKDQNRRFDTLWGSTMTVMHMTLGEFNFEDLDDSHMPVLAKIIFLVFALLLPILLLNMLIAMMGNTYRQIISGANSHWKRQRAQTVLVLEYSLFSFCLRSRFHKYALAVREGSSELGIMVTRGPEQRVLPDRT